MLGSIFVLWHLAAVVLPPLSVGASGGSKLWQTVSIPFWPYVDIFDLNHGYRFFGPDPGPGHLIRYQLEMPDGSRRDGVFPNLAEERPRLLYHRYFMLSEHLEGLYGAMMMTDEMLKGAESELPPSAPVRLELEQHYPQDKAAFDAVVRSYADELLHKAGAKSVHMQLIEHAIPPPDVFLKIHRLDDPSSYRTLLDLGTFSEQSR